MGDNLRLKTLICFFFFYLFFIFPKVVNAADYYVSIEGNDTNPGSSQLPWRTFSKAISVIGPGDNLKIFGGIYSERLVVGKNGTVGQPISISAQEGQKVIIDLDSTANNLVSITGSYIDISGLEVKDSSGTCVNLGGQYIVSRDFIVHDCFGHGTFTDGQHITIKNHTIYNTNLENSARIATSGWGSALKVRVGGDDILLEDNTIYHNYGEGIGVTRGKNVIIRNNRVYDNFAVNIYIDNSIDVLTEKNFVTCQANTGFEYSDGSRPTAIALAEEYYEGWGAQLANITIQNNIVAFCQRGLAYWGSDTDGQGGLKDVKIIYNTIWGSLNTALSLAWEPYKTQNSFIANNIIQQPSNKLAWVENKTGLTFHNNFWVNTLPSDTNARGQDDKYGDVKLAQIPSYDVQTFKLSAQSPAIDSANNLYEIITDFINNSRGSLTDIGAFEYKYHYPADLNGDGIVNLGDLARVISVWGQSGKPEDLNGDGVVGLADLQVILSNWGVI